MLKVLLAVIGCFDAVMVRRTDPAIGSMVCTENFRVVTY